MLRDLRDESDASGSNTTDELQSYCFAGMEDESVDVLDYWKRCASTYPTLAMMARDIFAVPVSTVSSESCFSSANRILTDKRSRLGPKVFERLVCLKDWIDAENRLQHQAIDPSSGHDTQESATDADDSDGEPDSEAADLWYMHVNY